METKEDMGKLAAAWWTISRRCNIDKWLKRRQSIRACRWTRKCVKISWLPVTILSTCNEHRLTDPRSLNFSILWCSVNFKKTCLRINKILRYIRYHRRINRCCSSNSSLKISSRFTKTRCSTKLTSSSCSCLTSFRGRMNCRISRTNKALTTTCRRTCNRYSRILIPPA